MPTSSTGNKSGVTLIELVVVMAIIALLVGVTLPAATSGLASVRLKGATNDIATFLTSALNRAERHEQVMEIIVYPKEARLELDSTEPGYVRSLAMPGGIGIVGDNPMRILLLPGSAPPHVAIDVFNDRGVHRIVTLDPVTGVPEIVIPQ